MSVDQRNRIIECALFSCLAFESVEALAKCWMHARHCAGDIVLIISSNLHSSLAKSVFLPLNCWGSKKLNNLTMVVQMKSDRAWIQIWVCCLRKLCCFCNNATQVFFFQSWCIAFYVLSGCIANYSTFSKDKKNFRSQLANRSTAGVKYDFPWLLLIDISLLTIYFCFAWSVYYLMIDCSHCNTTSEYRPRSVERDCVQIWNLSVHCHCVGADFLFPSSFLVSHPLLPSSLFLPLFPSITPLLLFSFPWLLSNPFSLSFSLMLLLLPLFSLSHLFLSSSFSFSLIFLFPKKKQLSEIQAIDRHTVLLWKGLQSPEGLHLLSSCVHKCGWGADISAHCCLFAKCGY